MEENGWEVYIVVEVICAVDFVLKFFVEKIEEGVVLKELEKIAKNYVTSFNFLIDFIALFPFPEIIRL